MNRIYKVIWSKVKNCYIVVSEIAKSHSKPVSKGFRQYVSAAAILAAVALLSIPAGVYAQDGVNTFVDPTNKNIKMGNGISLRNNNGQNGTVAIGDHVQVDDYVMQQGSVAIGTNAFVENMWGGQERTFRFGMTENKDLMAGIAIGQNTYARSGIQIGDHKYIGRLGDTTVDPTTDSGKRNLAIVMGTTTLGHNSYSNGAFTTNTGAFSIMTNGYESGNAMMVGQNFGAVIDGSFNSIESKTSSNMYSGIANAVVGTVNRTNNSNGTLIFGAGNEVTNSVEDIKVPLLGYTPSDAKDLADTLRSNIRGTDGNGTPGGAVLAIGGGNKADYATRSQLSGVGNTLIGTSSSRASYNMLNGYRNKGTTTSYATMIGTLNTVTNGTNNIIVGNKQKLTSASNNIVLGTADSEIETTVSDAVAIGHNSKTTATGGVALGTGSVASTALGQQGYDPSTKANSTSSAISWKSTAGAVSVGNASSNITRQITGVAAGTQDTDAVNVAQLRQVASSSGGGHYYSVNDASTIEGINPELPAMMKSLGNYNNDGAQAIFSIASGIGSTVRLDNQSGMMGVDERGMGSSVFGVLNTLDANSAELHDGTVNSVLGMGNTLKKANASVVLGAGNLVTNVFNETGDINFNPVDIKDNPEQLTKGVADSMVAKGGQVSVVGGANVIDYAHTSSIVGGLNNLQGTEDSVSTYNTISGFNNNLTQVNNLSVIGTDNEVSNSNNTILLGDNRTVTGSDNSIILGGANKTATTTLRAAADTTLTTTADNVVVMGYNANATVDDGVALGSNSVASVDKGVAGYNPSSKTLTGDAWTSTIGSVSVGDVANGVTRQITSVAAGKEDTDAVNVATVKS